MVRDLTVGSQTAFVFVDYTLSPEAKYPTAIEQAYEVTKYVIKHAEELKLDPSRLAVAGDSVGGNMATAMALLAKERKDFKVDCQLLIYPVTDANFDNETYKEFANGPWLTKKAMEWFWDNYLPEKDKRKEITACPLQASLDQLRGLPSTIVITDDHDVLGGEGRAYAEKLKQAGVPVISKEIFGTCHDFMMINELANTNACKEAMTAACQFLKKELKAD
jgi:acetyl esterase/lipase